jgi:hypothetical protein
MNAITRGIIDTLAAGAIILALAHHAKAHDTWSDGKPVPAWVKKSCCGPEDVHHLDPDQVHRVPGGFKIDGWPEVIPGDSVLPSQDGDYWAFYDLNWHGWGPRFFCFFAPLTF